jgi:hypothetical protein
MPALGAGARPRAHSGANLVTGEPLVGPEGQCQCDGDRPVHIAAQQTARRGGDHRAASPAPIAPEPQRQRFRAGSGLPGAHHRPLSDTMPDEPEPPASSGRARNATARAACRAHGPNRRWHVRPKFDVDLEIRDPLIAPLPFVDRCRSTTGTTIGVGSPSPFLSWSAPRRCTASMLAGYRPEPSTSKILTMGISQVSRHSPSRHVSGIGLPDINWHGRLQPPAKQALPGPPNRSISDFRCHRRGLHCHIPMHPKNWLPSSSHCSCSATRSYGQRPRLVEQQSPQIDHTRRARHFVIADRIGVTVAKLPVAVEPPAANTDIRDRNASVRAARRQKVQATNTS